MSESRNSGRGSGRLIRAAAEVGGLSLAARAVFVVFLCGYSWRFLVSGVAALGFEPGGIHFINLVFHEAGHVLLMWAPRIVCVLGGSAGQTAVPLILMLAFLIRNRDGFGAAVCMWWTGQSLVDIAPYINDARLLQMPLLGGRTGMEVEGHDWEYILTQWNLLDSDVYIARTVFATGRIVMVLALIWLAAWLTVQAFRIWGRRANPQAPLTI